MERNPPSNDYPTPAPDVDSLSSRSSAEDDVSRPLLNEKSELDLESQSALSRESEESTHPDIALESQVSSRRKLLFLAAHFSLNLSLTIYNKACMGSFPFPWLLTVVHTSCLCLGCTVLLIGGHFSVGKLSWTENLKLLAFSTLFTANIAVSNLSL